MYAESIKASTSNYNNPQSVKVASAIDSAMHNLDLALNDLGMASEVLANRLAPVSLPMPPGVESKTNIAPVPSGGSHHARQLHEQADRVQRIVAQLQDAANRLEV